MRGFTERQLLAVIPRLRAYAHTLRHDAEAGDLLQQTLLKLWGGRDKYEDRGISFDKWCITVMHNEYVNNVRRAARESRIVDRSVDAEAVGRYVGAPNNAAARAIIRDVERALASLPGGQRTAIHLSLDGLSQEEAAQVTGWPVGTVRSRLSRGRKSMRQLCL